MTTMTDLMIQHDCATDCSASSHGMQDRGRALQAGYFAAEDAAKLAAIRARKLAASKGKSDKCACDDCKCSDCKCGEKRACGNCA